MPSTRRRRHGVIAAIVVDTTEYVDRVYRKALELGGTDKGTAGPLGDGHCTGCFRDIDGSKPDAFGIPRKQLTRRARPWAAGQRIS
jgi:predicted lactoylglutathione lyase